MERFTGLELLSYPDHQGLRDLIGFGFDTWFEEPDLTVHTFGFLIQWLSVLDDPNLAHLKEELTSGGAWDVTRRLSCTTIWWRCPGESIESYVQSRLESISVHAEAIKAIAVGRLVADLHPDREGSPSLREVGLLAP